MATIQLNGQADVSPDGFEKRMNELLAEWAKKRIEQRQLKAAAVVNNLVMLRKDLDEMGPIMERKVNAAVLLADVCSALQLTKDETIAVLGFELTDDMMWGLACGQRVGDGTNDAPVAVRVEDIYNLGAIHC